MTEIRVKKRNGRGDEADAPKQWTEGYVYVVQYKGSIGFSECPREMHDGGAHAIPPCEWPRKWWGIDEGYKVK